MTESVYIIGGSGFIGKHISVFLSEYYDVIIFDKIIDRDYFTLYPTIKCYELDVVTNLIPPAFETPSFILNLASTLVTATRELKDLDQVISENVKIVMNLYDRFHNQNTLKLFIQFGSIEEYGNGQSPYVEEQREIPNSTYGILKQTTSNLALLLQSNQGFPAMVVRPGNLFGKYQNDQRFVSYLFNQLKQNKTVEVTLCEQKRDFIYVVDFVRIIQKILKRYEVFVGEIVNVSSGESIQLKQILEQMKSLLASTSEILYGEIPYRENEPMDLRCSVIKIEKLLGEPMKKNTMKRLEDYIKMTK
ncbi:MAG: NAD-dependent epimerase/dehydratase family protein [Paludibacter sp.]|nr:NAD-dependent epimerase/dehydratase family protein [Paludibacter sp.]